jgi:signal transduction histidine kinase
MGARPETVGRTEERWVYLSFVVPMILVVCDSLALAWFTVWGWAATQWSSYPFTSANLVGMWAFSLVPALIGAAAMLLFYPKDQPWAWRLTVAALFSVMAGLLRIGVEYAVWGSPFLFGPLLLEALLSVSIPFSCITFAMYLAKSQIQSVKTERKLTELEFKARQDTLERENAELKVRREFSAVLHDQIQQRLVFAASRLQTEVIPLALKSNDELGVKLLGEVVADIDRLREDDVRQLSHSLFPLGADLGLHQALSLALGRIPASVEVHVTTSDEAAEFDTILDPQWDIGHRAVLVDILDEAITNALKHGRADEVWVNLEVDGHGADRSVVLTVSNNGSPVGPAPVLSGLANHRIRAQLRGGGLNLGVDHDGRTRVVAWLPATPPPTDDEVEGATALGSSSQAEAAGAERAQDTASDTPGGPAAARGPGGGPPRVSD